MRLKPRLRKTIYFLTAILLVWAVSWLLRPTYQGHGMSWWFDQYKRDYSLEMRHGHLPHSSRQMEAIRAFQSFGEEGTAYLVEAVETMFEGNPADRLYILLLTYLPWNEHRSFSWEWMQTGTAAADLLLHLGMPYQWADEFGAQASRHLDRTNAFHVQMLLLEAATNRADILVESLLPHLDPSTSEMHWDGVLHVLSQTNLNADAAIPHLVKHPPGKAALFHPVYAKLASRSADVDAMLQDLMQNEDPEVAFLAGLARLSTDGEHPAAIERMESILDGAVQAKAADKNRLHHQLRILRSWPYPLTGLYPVLRQLALKSDHALVPVVELLLDRGEDISVFVPELERLLTSKALNSKPGFTHTSAFRICMLLLSRDPDHSKVWAYLDQDMAGRGRASVGPLMCLETSLIQLLAPHHKQAASILAARPKASFRQREAHLITVRAYLRKYRLFEDVE